VCLNITLVLLGKGFRPYASRIFLIRKRAYDLPDHDEWSGRCQQPSAHESCSIRYETLFRVSLQMLFTMCLYKAVPVYSSILRTALLQHFRFWLSFLACSFSGSGILPGPFLLAFFLANLSVFLSERVLPNHGLVVMLFSPEQPYSGQRRLSCPVATGLCVCKSRFWLVPAFCSALLFSHFYPLDQLGSVVHRWIGEAAEWKSLAVGIKLLVLAVFVRVRTCCLWLCVCVLICGWAWVWDSMG